MTRKSRGFVHTHASKGTTPTPDESCVGADADVDAGADADADTHLATCPPYVATSATAFADHPTVCETFAQDTGHHLLGLS